MRVVFNAHQFFSLPFPQKKKFTVASSVTAITTISRCCSCPHLNKWKTPENQNPNFGLKIQIYVYHQRKNRGFQPCWVQKWPLYYAYSVHWWGFGHFIFPNSWRSLCNSHQMFWGKTRQPDFPEYRPSVEVLTNLLFISYSHSSIFSNVTRRLLKENWRIHSTDDAMDTDGPMDGA